jgi:hypothetical protein
VQLRGIPFQITDWAAIEPSVHPGETGVARWHTRQFGDIRVRVVEYSAGHKADHWCEKGHVLYCVSGELHTELKDGRVEILKPGMSYQVSDGTEPHRSFTELGATLFIVD